MSSPTPSYSEKNIRLILDYCSEVEQKSRSDKDKALAIRPILSQTFELHSLLNEEAAKVSTLFETMNQCIHRDFAKYSDVYTEHIEKSRKMIIEGVDPSLKKRLIVLGPGLIEPLDQLTATFEDVIYIDNDDTYLKLLATKYKNSRYVKFDLTQGSLIEAQRFIAQARLEKWSKELFIKKLTPLFDALTRDQDSSTSIPAAPADYIVSSFIITQLANQVTIYIENRMQELYSWDRPEDETLLLSLNDAFQNFRQFMQKKHLAILKNSVNKQGQIYLADAVEGTQKDEASLSKYSFKMIEPSVLDTISSHFKIIKHLTWDWVSAPKGAFPNNLNQSMTFHVQAWILKNI